MAVTAAGRNARTHYRVEEAYGQGAALVRCKLETGRTHQIRVHLSHIGHPVLGDPVYARVSKARRANLGAAAEAVGMLKKQALHAALLGFKHPISANHVVFTSDLPSDLRCLQNILTGLSS
jgi:23S rRNA pseudouridine1911/1915/1917 synthase